MNLLDLVQQAQTNAQAGDKSFASAPLAERMKPKNLDEFVGQEAILGEGTLLRRMIRADQMRSLLFYGPTGVGKTSIARIIANMTKSAFISINAVTAGIKDIKEAILEAENHMLVGKKTILFVDEIHRFNKSQQDALLPYVEKGTVCLIGATTENPYFEVNGALISRSMIFRLEALDESALTEIVKRAVQEPGRGLGDYAPLVTDEALEALVRFCSGDARKALNALELAVLSTDPDYKGDIVVDLDAVKSCFQRQNLRYDKGGDAHYDVISAFIKSIRGSDPSAALHYLARMLESGEDPMFIARRVVISASEDVGNANPMALVIATAACDAVRLVGLPEGRIALAQAVTYLASSPKSNAAYNGINQALADVATRPIGEVPMHLRDSSYKGARAFGHGEGYLYPHSYEGAYVAQQYLPDELVKIQYYQPTDRGDEAKLKGYLQSITRL